MGTSGESAEVRSRPPPPLILEAVHLRVYGPDARYSFLRPWRAADADTSLNKDAGIPAGDMGTAEGVETGTNAGGVASASRVGSSSGEEPLRGDWADGRSRVASAVPPAGLLTGGSKARRSVPPAMSARCQLHPHVLSRLGLQQGDPILVFARLETCTARDIRASQKGFSRRVGIVSSTESPGRGARDDGFATSPSRSYSMTPSDKHPHGATNQGQDDQVNGSAESDVQEARAPGTDTSQGSGERSARASFEGDEVCFLCTAWANAFLAPTEATVDGRVVIPLAGRKHDTAGAARVPLELSGLGPERNGKQSGGIHSSSVAGALIDGAFSEASVTQPVSLSSATPVERSRRVGVVPVTGDVFGACFSDCGYPVPSIATRATVGYVEPEGYGRVSATTDSCKSRVVSMAGGSPLATQGTPASATPSKDAASAGRGANSPGVDGSSRRGRVGVKGARDPRLRPEYTWLVKRSLRHLVLCEGCIVAVPACPSDDADDRGDRRAQGGAINSLESVSGDLAVEFVRVTTFTSSSDSVPSAPGSSGSRARTRSFPRNTPHGSGVDFGDWGSCPLGFLSGRRLCVLGPDTTILVTQQEGSVAIHGGGDFHGGGNGLSGPQWEAESGLTMKTADRAADGDGSEARFEGGAASGLRNMGPRTPTQALAELMLLPMTAPIPSEEGVQGLGFSIPRGVLLTGPPGVGKTFAVRSAVDSVREHPAGTGETPFQVKMTTLNGAEVLSLGQWEACRALQEAFDSATAWSRGGHGRVADAGRGRCRRCAVIFLDEADALLTRRDLDGDRAAGGEGARALAQLLTLMDGFHKRHDGSSNLLIVGATNRPGALDPALRRPGRFDREVALAPPDELERAEILRSHLEGLQVEGGSSTILEAAGKCVGYVGADLAALAREAALVAARRSAGQVELAGGSKMVPPKVGSADLTLGMEKVGASSLRGHQVSIPDTPWSAIGGMEEAKAKLRQAVEWPVRNKEAFARMGLTAPRGILLYGPPGCSKTTLVRAAATAAGATFVCLSGADVFSPYLGEAEATIRQAFLTSRNAAPALLFFDEIDAIVANREAGGKGSCSSAESRVLATFLTEMDGVGALRGDGVIVVAATNRPEAVDKALLRPGRFDQLIYAPLPDVSARRKIFEVHTRKMVLDRSDVDFDQLASACTGLTGAEIEGVCREAGMSAIRETGLGGNVAGGRPGLIRPAKASDGRDDKNLEETTGPERHGRAVVKHRHLLAASLAAAAKPGVSRAMVAGYERFGAWC